MKKFVLIIISLSAFGISCKKSWLDVKSDKSQAVPSSLDDFQALLNNAFAINYYTPSLGEVAADGHYILDDAWNNSKSDQSKNAYTWSHDRAYKTIDDWNQTYSGRVFYSNLILEGLQKISSAIDQNKWNNIKGQCLFQRSDAFYDLTQIWAPPYQSATASTDIGIPLRRSSDVTIPSVQSSVAETYDQIVNDLKEAEGLLPQVSSFLTRPSKTAAQALLARVYMSMSNYDSALNYANKCLQNYNALLDYNSLSATIGYIGLFNKEVIFHKSFVGYSFITSDCLIDSNLYNAYDTNDLRKSLFFITGPNNQITFQGNYSNNSNDLFCGLATDEVYLIRAECNARKGNISQAMSDLNTLLLKRWKSGTFQPLSASNIQDALNKILAERKKELVLRGTRWTDLRRLNLDPTTAVTLSRTIGGKTYTLSPNAFRYTFPIPDDIIQISHLKQNPGW